MNELGVNKSVHISQSYIFSDTKYIPKHKNFIHYISQRTEAYTYKVTGIGFGYLREPMFIVVQIISKMSQLYIKEMDV